MGKSSQFNTAIPPRPTISSYSSSPSTTPLLKVVGDTGSDSSNPREAESSASPPPPSGPNPVEDHLKQPPTTGRPPSTYGQHSYGSHSPNNAGPSGSAGPQTAPSSQYLPFFGQPPREHQQPLWGQNAYNPYGHGSSTFYAHGQSYPYGTNGHQYPYIAMPQLVLPTQQSPSHQSFPYWQAPGYQHPNYQYTMPPHPTGFSSGFHPGAQVPRQFSNAPGFRPPQICLYTHLNDNGTRRDPMKQGSGPDYAICECGEQLNTGTQEEIDNHFQKHAMVYMQPREQSNPNFAASYRSRWRARHDKEAMWPL